MSRRILVFIALLLLTVFSLCACNGNGGDGDGGTTEKISETITDNQENSTKEETSEIETREEAKTIVYNDYVTVSEEESDTQSEPEKSYKFELDCEKALSNNDPDWFVNPTARFENGILTSEHGQHFYVSERKKISADVYTVALDVKAQINNAPFVTGYVGIRLPNFDNEYIATQGLGIWIAVRNSNIGLMTGTWPNTEYMTIPFSFADFRRLYIEDNTVDDVVTLFVENDSGERVYVGRIVITDNINIVMYDTNNNACVNAKAAAELEDSGYVCFWGHLNDGVYYDNLSVEWQENTQKAYVPSNPADIRELYADAWVAVDNLDRTVSAVNNAKSKDKLVGMFYQLWHQSTDAVYPDQILYDHTSAYLEGGADAVKDMLQKGPVSWPHYWAEPYFGYYVLTDKWVIRKHAQMLTDIGVDFIYLDVTNGHPFTTNYKTIFREYKALRDEGVDTPDIAFFLGVDPKANAKVFEDLWLNIYENDLYSELYCMYEGKILLLGDTSAIDQSKLEKFTVRDCWALNSQINGGKDKWSWMLETPQTPSVNTATGKIEEISISAGLLANTSVGRSYTVKGGQPRLAEDDLFQYKLESTPYGLFFAEQMQNAVKYDPPVLLINAWNEWTAGRWETTISGVLIANTYKTCSGEEWTKNYYVDAFNPEFSRDIEPMRNKNGYGFGDNYYYQLAAFLREFKGSRPSMPVSGQRTIDIYGDISQWDSVFPEYRDTKGDTYHRSCTSWNNYFYYTNDSGRNDIVSAKVSQTSEYIYFLVSCSEDITPVADNWMVLYIDSDADLTTGWSGFDYVLSGAAVGQDGKGTVTVYRFLDSSFDKEAVGRADIYLQGKNLQVKLDASLIAIKGSFNFKWADNSVDNGDAMGFLDLGDAAPDARFAYAFNPSSDNSLNSELTPYIEDGAAFRVNSCYVASEGKLSILDDESDKLTPVYHENRIFLPASALSHLSGMTVDISEDGKTVTLKSGETSMVFTDGDTCVAYGIHTIVIPSAPYMENGHLYIPLNAVAHFMGYQYAENVSGCVIITRKDIDDSDSILNLVLETV